MSRILIVEDEMLIAELLVMYVEDLGHEILGPAATVNDALEILNRDRPDFAILDCTLGTTPSTPVAEELAKNNLPFAFATGHGVDALPHEFKTRPMIIKPYTIDDVERILSELAP